MGSKEILTLQFGHYANYVGTHWWNIQELGFEYNTNVVSEINHDVLYREGLTHKGEITYTPRLLLVDLKGSLKTLPQEGDLYEPLPKPDTSLAHWDEKLVQIQTETPIPKNKFQQSLENLKGASTCIDNKNNLDDEIEVWSDFLYTKFHPKTVNIVSEYEHQNVNKAFDLFHAGCDLWATEQFADDFSDRIRNYIEECDSFQGFHILLDAVDGFSGLSTSCIEYLKDDYERKPVLAFPIIPSHYQDYEYNTDAERNQSIISDSVRLLNTFLCFDVLGQDSSLFVPLSTGSTGWRQPGPKREFYHTIYNHKSPYHTSAILASALDTFTLKHRLRSENYCLMDLKADLTGHGRKTACASLCLPFSLNKDAELIECLDNWEGPLSQCISPSCSIGEDYLMQMITLRGIPEDRLKKPPNLAAKQENMAAYKCNSIKEMMSLYLACNHYCSASNVTVVNKALPTKLPFPKIFDPYVGFNGNIWATERTDDTVVQSVPVLAGLHSGSEVGNMLDSLHTEVKKMNVKRLPHFTTGRLESDDLSECLNRLSQLSECYKDSYLL